MVNDFPIHEGLFFVLVWLSDWVCVCSTVPYQLIPWHGSRPVSEFVLAVNIEGAHRYTIKSPIETQRVLKTKFLVMLNVNIPKVTYETLKGAQ